jgi:hypothetical protein
MRVAARTLTVGVVVAVTVGVAVVAFWMIDILPMAAFLGVAVIYAVLSSQQTSGRARRPGEGAPADAEPGTTDG